MSACDRACSTCCPVSYPRSVANLKTENEILGSGELVGLILPRELPQPRRHSHRLFARDLERAETDKREGGGGFGLVPYRTPLPALGPPAEAVGESVEQ